MMINPQHKIAVLAQQRNHAMDGLAELNAITMAVNAELEATKAQLAEAQAEIAALKAKYEPSPAQTQ